MFCGYQGKSRGLPALFSENEIVRMSRASCSPGANHLYRLRSQRFRAISQPALTISRALSGRHHTARADGVSTTVRSGGRMPSFVRTCRSMRPGSEVPVPARAHPHHQPVGGPVRRPGAALRPRSGSPNQLPPSNPFSITVGIRIRRNLNSRLWVSRRNRCKSRCPGARKMKSSEPPGRHGLPAALHRDE